VARRWTASEPPKAAAIAPSARAINASTDALEAVLAVWSAAALAVCRLILGLRELRLGLVEALGGVLGADLQLRGHDCHDVLTRLLGLLATASSCGMVVAICCAASAVMLAGSGSTGWR
jgi:hypothetical protein